MALTLATLMAPTAASGSDRTASAVDLIPGLQEGSWIVSGLSSRTLDSVPASVGLVRWPTAWSAEISIFEGQRLTLLDREGRLAGVLNGPLGGANGIVSFVVDQQTDELVVNWSDVAGAQLYVYTLGGTSAAVMTRPLRIPLAEARPNDNVTVSALPHPNSELTEAISTVSVVFSDYEAARGNAVAGEGNGVSAGSYVTSSSHPTYTDFRFKTFIPEPYVDAPTICNGGFSNDRYFGGDNRSWSATSTNNRTYAHIAVVWSGTDWTSKSVGRTKLYQKVGTSYNLLETRQASASGISITGPYNWGSGKGFNIDHSVGNPFCPGVGVIDYTANAVVQQQAGYNGFSVGGSHDRAPNCEFYYSDSTTGYHQFRAWVHGLYSCLSACTQVSYYVSK